MVGIKAQEAGHILHSLEQQAQEVALGSQSSPTARTRFWYGSDGQRYLREDGLSGVKRTKYLGNVEIITQAGQTTLRRYVAGVAVQDIVPASACAASQSIATDIACSKYLIHDQLGSVVHVLAAVGTIESSLDYGPFGERCGGVQSGGFLPGAPRPAPTAASPATRCSTSSTSCT